MQNLTVIEMPIEGWIEEDLYTKIKRQMPIPAVDLLVKYKGRLLLMLRNNEPAKDEWFTPGGRILYGEEIDDAVRRVLLEETGLKPHTIKFKGVMSHLWPECHMITAYYLVEVDSAEVVLNDEHRDYRWIPEFPENLHPYIKEMIKRSNIFTSNKT